jgi:hypothetical protein
MSRTPNFFLVGAAKSGTSSLYAALGRHPQVFLSPLKEPHFFSTFAVDRRTARLQGIVRDEQRYRRLFDGAADESIVGEGSTSYLWDPSAPPRIADVAPGARILAVLRDPVERAWSHYLNDVREGIESRRLVDAARQELESPDSARWPSAYVGFGRYAEQLPRFLDRFGDVLVLFFEELVADTEGQTRRVLEFLGVDPELPPGPSAPANAYARPRSEVVRRLLGNAPLRLAARAAVPRRLRPASKRLVWTRDERPEIDPEARALLEEAYGADLGALTRLLGTEPPWPRQ